MRQKKVRKIAYLGSTIYSGARRDIAQYLQLKKTFGNTG